MSDELSQDFIHILRQAASSDVVDLKLSSEFSYSYIYTQIIKRLISLRPRYSQYAELMFEPEIQQNSERVVWILIYSVISQNVLTKDLAILYQKVFDRLSLGYSSLRKRLSKISDSITGRVIDFWSCAISATLFQLLMNEYYTTELAYSISFTLSVETDVCNLLIGFASPNVQAFHSIVYSLLNWKVRKYIPKVITGIISEEEGFSSLHTALKNEPKIAENVKNGSGFLFNENTRTSLIDNALRLSGTKAPATPRGRNFQRGSSERSKMISVKAEEIMKQAKSAVNQHELVRDETLIDICEIEKVCNEKATNVDVSPLSFTFETFGFDPLGEKMSLSGVLSESFDGKVSPPRTWRESTKAVKKPKVLPSESEMFQMINDAHNHLRSSGILAFISIKPKEKK